MQQKITHPETDSSSEWIHGKAVPKVAPFRPHGIIQMKLGAILGAWAEAKGCGEVGTEWQFRIGPPGEEIRPQIPDIAYLSYEREGDASDEDLSSPLVPPNLAVEILSPSNVPDNISEKTRVYLAAGTDLVLIVDPEKQTIETIETIDRSGRRTYVLGETLTHPALPGFELDTSALFSALRRPQKRDSSKSIKTKVDNADTPDSPDSHRHR